MSDIREAIAKKAKELFSQIDPHAEITVEIFYNVEIHLVWPEDSNKRRAKREEFYAKECDMLEAFRGALIDFQYIEQKEEGP